MSACSRLGKKRKSSLRSLGFYAKRYASQIQGWIDPNVPGSFESLLREHKKALEESYEPIRRDLPINVLVATGGNFALGGAPSKRAGVWMDFSIGNSGELVSDGLHDRSDTKFIGLNEPLSEFSKFGISTPHWWTTREFGSILQYYAQRTAIYSDLYGRVDAAVWGSRVYPARIKEFQEAVESIKSLLDVCNDLALLDS